MAERRSSLLDDAGLSQSATASKKNTPKGGSGDKVKLLVAIGIFAVAALVILWSNGMIFSGQPEYAPPPPEMQQAYEEQQKANEVLIKSGKATTGGE